MCNSHYNININYTLILNIFYTKCLLLMISNFKIIIIGLLQKKNIAICNFTNIYFVNCVKMFVLIHNEIMLFKLQFVFSYIMQV